MSDPQEKDISKLFEEPTEIHLAMRRAVRDALKFHKAIGNPVAAWRNGAVVWIPAEDIEIPDDDGLAD